MTLQKRLARLEAQCQGIKEGPRVIVFDACWRDDDGNLQSIASFAHVLTRSGWHHAQRLEGEPEADFLARAEGMIGQIRTGTDL